MGQPLTKPQKEVLDFIAAYQAKYGVAPTLKEIAKSFHFNTGAAQYHVRQLVLKGYIRSYPRKERGLEIL